MFKTYCRALIESFYNPRVYREAITAWQGFAGMYVALLAAITGSILLVAFLLSIHRFETSELNHLIDQVPPIKIEEGIITVENEQPVVITNSEKNLTITIDTSKSESELRDTDTQIGIGRTFMFVHYNGQYEVMYTDKLRDANILINKDNLRNMWDTNIATVKTIAFPLLWLGQFLNLMITCAIVAFLSYFITTFMKEEYIFLTRMRLAALALTPASIISMVLRLTIAHQTAPWFSLLLAMLYLYVMLMLMRKLYPADPVEIQS